MNATRRERCYRSGVASEAMYEARQRKAYAVWLCVRVFSASSVLYSDSGSGAY